MLNQTLYQRYNKINYRLQLHQNQIILCLINILNLIIRIIMDGID